uniref:Uncharacterized protein n=1 Tax=Pristionchus pacificus TaxID=54126 RepID=A0A2A6BNY5_PRIPA|eukprot:PDM67635.1 hypothetical protein PRIPAC_45679 [Pristionchus pacificus]
MYQTDPRRGTAGQKPLFWWLVATIVMVILISLVGAACWAIVRRRRGRTTRRLVHKRPNMAEHQPAARIAIAQKLTERAPAKFLTGHLENFDEFRAQAVNR